LNTCSIAIIVVTTVSGAITVAIAATTDIAATTVARVPAL
jgi:hypothetical protein